MEYWLPACSIAEANQRLLAHESPFALTAERAWRHAPRNLCAIFRGTARFGAREFLVLDETRVAYDAQARAACALARALAERGVAVGDRVAIGYRNGPELAAAFFGAALLGAIPALLNPYETPQKLREAIALVSPRATLLGPGLGDGGDRVEALIGPTAEWAALPAATFDGWADPEPDADAALLFTSGTTGAPRAVILSHRNLATGVMNLAFAHARARVRRGETPLDPSPTPPVTLLPVPLFHATGLVAGLLPTMLQGGKLLLMRRWRAEEGVALMAAEGATHLGGVPTIAIKTIEAMRLKEQALALRVVSFGGGAAPRGLAAGVSEAFAGAYPATGWGMTETAGPAISNAGEDYRAPGELRAARADFGGPYSARRRQPR